MTDEVRNEAKHYRELAKLIEERLKLRKKYPRKITKASSSSDSNTEVIEDETMNISTTSIEDTFDNKSGLGDSEYLKISSMVARKLVDATYRHSPPKNSNSSNGSAMQNNDYCESNKFSILEERSKSRLDHRNDKCIFNELKKYENLSRDKRLSTVACDFSANRNLSEVCELISPKNDLLKLSNAKSSVVNDDIDIQSCTMDLLSPTSSFKSCLTDEHTPFLSAHKFADHDHLFKSASYAPSTFNSDSPSKLVRSNSYTLLTPSPLLVKHLESQGVSINRTSNSMEDLTKQSKSCKVRKSNPLIPINKFKDNNIAPKKLNVSSNTSVKKYMSSPYDAKLPTTLKRGNKFKPKISPVAPNKFQNHSTPLSSKTSASSSPKSLLDENNIKTILSKIEHEKKRQISDLVKKQQLEQQKLEETFKTQQNLLLQQLQKSVVSSYKLESPTENKIRKSKNLHIRSVSQHELTTKYKQVKKSNDEQPEYLKFLTEHSSRMSQSFSVDDKSPSDKLNCSRKLFEQNATITKNEQQEQHQRTKNEVSAHKGLKKIKI